MIQNTKEKSEKFSNYEWWKGTVYDIIVKADSINKLNIEYLSKKLPYSKRHIRRLINKYKDSTYSIIHKNKGKTNTKIKDKNLDQTIVDTYIKVKEKINQNRNDNHFELPHKYFYEYYIKDKFDVSYNYANKLLNQNFLITKNTKRKTRKKLKKRLKEIQSNNDEKLNNLQLKILETRINQSFIEYQNQKKIPYVKHDKNFGQTVEIDACVEYWFNNEKYYLYHAIDAGTGMLLAIHLEKEETNKGYAVLLKQLFEKYGAPIEIRADRRKSFWNENGGDTNLSHCLKELEIRIITNSEPTFKPNVERSFKNAQNIYPLIFSLNQIKTYDDAKIFLPNLLKIYNEKFNKINTKENEFIKLSKEQINNSLYFQKILNVHNGFYVYFENKSLCLIDKQGYRKIMKNKILIKKDFLTEELFTILSDGNKYYFKEINEQDIKNFHETVFDNEWIKLEKEKNKIKSKTKEIRLNLEIKEKKLKEKELELQSKLNEIEKEKMML